MTRQSLVETRQEQENMDEQIPASEMRQFMSGVMTRLDKIDNTLDNIDTRLDNIDNRLDNIDTRLDNIDTRLNNVEIKLEYVYTNSASVKGDVGQIKRAIQASVILGVRVVPPNHTPGGVGYIFPLYSLANL